MSLNITTCEHAVDLRYYACNLCQQRDGDATISHLQQSLRECERKLREADDRANKLADECEEALCQDIIRHCAAAWPDKKLMWSESPVELITDMVNELDETRDQRDAALAERDELRALADSHDADFTALDGRWRAELDAALAREREARGWVRELIDRHLDDSYTSTGVWHVFNRRLADTEPSSALPTAVEPDEAAQCGGTGRVPCQWTRVEDGADLGVHMEACLGCPDCRQAQKADKGSGG